MIHLTKGSTSQSFIVTLNEKKTLASPYYLFVFKSTTGRDEVKFIIDSSSDLSAYPDRFNKFTIDVSSRFPNAMIGQYTYDVYEQTSSINTDPLLSTGKVETGKMFMDPATGFAFTGYSPTTQIVGYDGR